MLETDQHLAVEIAGDRIIVTMPRTGHEATYCKRSSPTHPRFT